MYEAIFAAPHDATGATAWLDEWKPILGVVLGDFARGEGLEVYQGGPNSPTQTAGIDICLGLGEKLPSLCISRV